jgi:hypothetical protein
MSGLWRWATVSPSHNKSRGFPSWVVYPCAASRTIQKTECVAKRIRHLATDRRKKRQPSLGSVRASGRGHTVLMLAGCADVAPATLARVFIRYGGVWTPDHGLLDAWHDLCRRISGVTDCSISIIEAISLIPLGAVSGATKACEGHRDRARASKRTECTASRPARSRIWCRQDVPSAMMTSSADAFRIAGNKAASAMAREAACVSA